LKSSIPPFLRLGAALAAMAFVSTAARADEAGAEATTARIKFSDPAKPGTLRAELPWADVHVTGSDVAEIVVTSSLNQKGREEPRPDGLRRLDQDVTFELAEKDNVATLQIAGDNAWSAHGSEFNIQVPRNTSLVLHTQAGGDIVVENVQGDIDINSMNGQVTLSDVGSSAVVNTMNGEIHAKFKIAPVKPVSLSSMNGEIALEVPADTKANLRMRSQNGAILTDFPENTLKTKSEARAKPVDGPPIAVPETGVTPAPAPSPNPDASQTTRDVQKAVREAQRAAEKAARDAQRAVEQAMRDAERAVNGHGPRPPHPPRMPVLPMFGGKSIVGTLNGGGVDIQLASMNGAITLRQAK
jgi:hypothetical protein